MAYCQLNKATGMIADNHILLFPPIQSEQINKKVTD